MKKLIITTLILITPMLNNMVSYGQVNNEPTYYLNSKQFNLHKVFLNPTRIDSVNVTKNSNFGEVSVFTKNRDFSFYRLSDILKKYTAINGIKEQILYRINGKVIEDTTFIEIDDTYFVYVMTEQLSDVKYISNKFKDLVIVNIDLEMKKREPTIYIRGDQDILDKLKK